MMPTEEGSVVYEIGENCNVLVYEYIIKSTTSFLFLSREDADDYDDTNGGGQNHIIPLSSSSSSPIQQCIVLCMFCIIITFVVSSITQNYSQVDKVWSVVPVLYTWICVCDDRTYLMAIMATIWGIRLTWNFSRRGGYKWPPWDGDEDYRWKYIQDGYFLPILSTNKALWIAFNFGFISLYQNILLLLIVSPSLVAHSVVAIHCSPRGRSNGGAPPLNLYDAIATLLFLFFVVIESIADNQQYNFQTEKHRRRRQQRHNSNQSSPPTGEYSDGFNQSGLFAIVRKPNYAAEQAIWISFYIYSIGALQGSTTRFINCSIIGCTLLVLLFVMSGWFTEKITLSKYPKYRDYMNQVPLYVPNLFLFFNNNRRSKASRETKSS